MKPELLLAERFSFACDQLLLAQQMGESDTVIVCFCKLLK